jgi:hypothetical protein
MFSKEWFTYVFGRWILLSGIAGAMVQYVLADRLTIPTIPAFLLNQLLLASVFWYVDKYIFRRHFSKVRELFRFPRIKGKFDIAYEMNKVDEEHSDLVQAYAQAGGKPEKWLNEFLDLTYAVEMTERVLTESGVNVDHERYRIVKNNEAKGLY